MTQPEPSESISGIHHVGVLVADLEQAEYLVTEVLGLEVTKRASLPDESTRMLFCRCGTAEVELIEISDPEVYARRSRVPGAPVEIEHIALAVSDLGAAVERLGGAGLRFTAGASKREEATEPLEVAGTKSLFTMPDSARGFLLQLIEDPAR